jgi:hypothetical protein
MREIVRQAEAAVFQGENINDSRKGTLSRLRARPTGRTDGEKRANARFCVEKRRAKTSFGC